VDPITGEGIYYALRSADLAARALLSESPTPEEKPEHYRQLLRSDFMDDLEVGSRFARRFFQGRFLRGPVTARMIQFARRSPRFSDIVQDLLSGRQSYLGLKRRLYENFAGSLYDIGMSLGFSRPRTRPVAAKP